MIMVLTWGQTRELLSLVKWIDQTVLGPKDTSKKKNAKNYFHAQVLDLHLIMTVGDAQLQNMKYTDEQDAEVTARNGITPFGLKAFIMGVLPQALASGYTAYVILTHNFYTAMWYPGVPIDWVVLNEDVTCMLTVVSGHAFLEKSMTKRLEKMPALQIFGKLRTRKQQRTVTENRYKTRTLENLFQRLYPCPKPRNFLTALVHNEGKPMDFPLSQEEFTQLRENLLSDLGRSKSDAFKEEVCQSVRPEKLIQFLPIANILDARNLPTFLTECPWLTLLREHAVGDPQHAFRNWALKYRLLNPITTYSSNYIAPQTEALEKFEKDHPGAKVNISFQDCRVLVKMRRIPGRMNW